MSVCLDAFVLLAWLQDEQGADLVEESLQRAAEEESFRSLLSVVNLGEPSQGNGQRRCFLGRGI